ncbi:hypothetical protein AURDEDRAFT_176814 [Auricularia subglabra TFB-10046 SS5]|nr:hypothetical protein AURDEDRAFT_176814 [Auricularia subglabra TFB-10046 SS5]
MVDDDFDMDELEHMVQQDQQPNLRHDPIEGPKGENPFDDDNMQLFKNALAEVISQEIIPSDYGVDPTEWEDGDYPDTETILIAGRSSEIQLTLAIWWPRAVLWAQGLDVMNAVLHG